MLRGLSVIVSRKESPIRLPLAGAEVESARRRVAPLSSQASAALAQPSCSGASTATVQEASGM